MSRIFEKNSLQRKEILKSRKAIADLFLSGKKIYRNPVLVYYNRTEYQRPSPIKVAFSVSSKKWKMAVGRTRIKRILREAYRINKHSLLNSAEQHAFGIHLMLIYVADREFSFEEVSRSVAVSLKELQDTLEIQ